MAEYDLDALVRDPDFQSRPFAQRREILREADPEGFGTLPDAAQSRMLVDMKGQEWWKGKGQKQAQHVTGNMNPTAAESEAFRRKAVADTGTTLQKAKELIPSRKQVADFARPALEGTGAALGGIGGAALGAGTGGVASPLLAVAGGATGYATGKYIADAIEGAPQSAPQTLKDLGTGAMYEMGGAVAGSTLGALSKRVVKPSAIGPEPKAEALGLSKLADGANIPKLETVINKGIDKGIRPGVAGNRTFKQSEGYHTKAQQAVKAIVENKDTLKLTDEYGEVVQGLPKNLRQFSQSIDQTKGNIFKQYDEMAKAAGESGAKVDLGGIPAELLSVANNKSLQLAAPDAAAYAQKRAAAFQKVNAATDGVTTTRNNFLAAEQAQEVIAMFNQSLESFYKNPSYDTASKAYIDSLIVNNLRKELDSVIEKSAGPGYQELKNAYGALKAIEKDVSQRAIVDARRNVKGLLDFSDVFSGSQVVGGLMSLNPATVGTGVSAKIIANLYKMKIDPNKIIEKMFKEVDKRYKPTPRAAFTPPTAAAKVAEVNPMEGKVNTLNLPVGPQRVKDPSSGRMIETAQSPMAANTSRLPVGPQRSFDPNVGSLVELSQQPMPTNTLASLAGEAKVLDPSTGMMISRRQPDIPANTGNLGREAAAPKPATKPANDAPKTWREFLKANMGAAMKSEGDHAAAVRKLAKEWNETKKKP